MKHSRLLRLLGMVIILSLLVMAVPAAPVMAANYEITVDPEEGDIGDEIEISGENFGYSDTQDRWVTIFFSSDDYAATGTGIGDEVMIYKIVEDGVEIEGETEDTYSGYWETTFDVPDRLYDYDEEEYVDVEAGTYYIYITVTTEADTDTSTYIRSYAEFEVTGGGREITLDPTSGTVGTQIEISGAGFTASKAITIEYDSIDLDVDSGSTSTSTSGAFSSVITVPDSAVGTHTVTVTINSIAAEATFTVRPKITLSASTAKAGDTISVTGTGFGKSKAVTLTISSGSATVTSNIYGSFGGTIEIPDTLAAGTYTVSAVDASSNTATIQISVTSATPTTTPPTTTPPTTTTPTTPVTIPLSLSQTSGNVGDYIMVGGAGFQAGATATIKYDDTAVATAVVQAGGAFLSNVFQVPASKYGAHTITATDGTHTGTAEFTVAEAAMSAPAIISPATQGKAKSPYTFTWNAAAAVNTPVTYDLQVATSSQFTAGSIVLSKTALTATEYAMTEIEETALLSSEADSYYWRIKATDAAQNESGWSSPTEFFAAAPFDFLHSPYLWVVVGFGVVILLLIGFLVGRRTAFYY